jgi:hypothetical protein
MAVIVLGISYARGSYFINDDGFSFTFESVPDIKFWLFHDIFGGVSSSIASCLAPIIKCYTHKIHKLISRIIVFPRDALDFLLDCRSTFDEIARIPWIDSSYCGHIPSIG